MRKIFIGIGSFIAKSIDVFYPLFSPYCSRQFFRYGVCGTVNIFFDWILYFIAYNFIFQKAMVHTSIVTVSPHIAALLVSFPISFLTGFLLQKYVTFSASELRGIKQLARYAGVVGINLALNYFGLKFFVEILHFYPTISKMLITVVCTVFSYYSQKHFTFKIQ